MLSTSDLMCLDGTLSRGLLRDTVYPWEALTKIENYILQLQSELDPQEYYIREGQVYIHKSALVDPSASLNGPCLIGADVEIRPHAFIRKAALIEQGCVIGASCELKNVLCLPYAQIAHLNYVGDSILGSHSHLGAGAITSNIKSDQSLVKVKNGDEIIATNLRKFGAILGDYVEVGCNAVLNPGTVIGKHSRIYPLALVRGVVPAKSIYKAYKSIVAIEDHTV